MAAVPNSILDTTKKVLGLEPDYDAFDVDIIMHINSTFSTMHQLGIGPTDGFEIEDNTAVWADFIGTDKRLNPVKTYIYLKVRSLFDPPSTSYAVTALEKGIAEAEFRLMVSAESDALAVKFPPEPIATPVDGYGF